MFTNHIAHLVVHVCVSKCFGFANVSRVYEFGYMTLKLDRSTFTF